MEKFSDFQIQHLVDVGKWATGSYIVLVGIENMVAQGKIILEDSDEFLSNIADVLSSAPEATRIAGFYSYMNIINDKKD